MQKDLITLYTSEGCYLCDGAFDNLRKIAWEFGVDYETITIDINSPDSPVPAVPAVCFRGALYIGSNWPKRLRIALLDKGKVNLENALGGNHSRSA